MGERIQRNPCRRSGPRQNDPAHRNVGTSVGPRGTQATHAHRRHAPSYCARYPPQNWTVLHACAAVTRATMGVSALHPTGCGSASRSSGTTACVPQPRSSSSDYVGTQHNTYATQQHVCNTAQLLQHRSTKCCNTGQLRVAGVWAVPHRRTTCSHARLVQSVQEAHARYAVHDLPRHVRLIAWQRTLLPVTVCSDFAHAVAALQRMAAAAGSKADRAALLARYLKHPGRKTFPVVRVHPFRGASHFSVTRSIRA